MPSSLQINLTYDSFSIGMDLPLAPIEAWSQSLVRRNEAARREDSDPPEPLRHWVFCPHCNADAAHLGAVHLDDRMVRICTRCESLFEVADGKT